MSGRPHEDEPGSTVLAILDASPVAIVCVDRHGVVTHWNPAAERLLGWASTEVVGSPLSLVPPEHEAALCADLDAVLAGESVAERELQALRSDGSRRDVGLSLAPLHEGDAITGVVAAIADVASRNAVEHEGDLAGRIVGLALSRGRMVAGQLDGVTGALTWFGEDSGRDFWRGSPPASVEALLADVVVEDRLAIAVGASSTSPLADVDFRVLDGDGATRWLQAHGLFVDDGAATTHVGVVRDVTETRRREAELRETSELLRAVIAASPVAVTASDVDGRVTMWSTAAEAMFGWTAEEVLGKPLPFVRAEDWPSIQDLRARVLAGEVVVDLEVVRLRKDGTALDVSLSIAPVLGPRGDVRGLVGILADVSERLLAERALREAEARYRTLVEQLPAVVYIDDVSDAQGRTLYVSPQVEPMFGISVEAWRESHLTTWLQFVHPDDRSTVLAAYERTVHGLESLDVEYRIGREERVRWVRDVARVIPANDGSPAQLHGIVLDITELKEVHVELERNVDLLRASDAARRRLVSRLVRAQEEERRLISGDLHNDAVQAMTAVSLRLGLLRGTAGNGTPPSPGDFDKLESTVRDAQRRLRRLLFELSPAELERGGLASTLATQLAQQKAEFGLAFRLENRLRQEPSLDTRVIVYRLVREALANVRAHARATEVVVELESRDAGVYAAVRDDGDGFEVERSLVGSRPSHLGLPAMHERVELAGGWLRVTSDPGAGTVVELWVPESLNDDEGEHDDVRPV